LFADIGHVASPDIPLCPAECQVFAALFEMAVEELCRQLYCPPVDFFPVHACGIGAQLRLRPATGIGTGRKKRVVTDSW
jgi:hypothetical protein